MIAICDQIAHTILFVHMNLLRIRFLLIFSNKNRINISFSRTHTTILLSTAQQLDVPETGAVGTCTIIDTLLNNCNNVQATLLPCIIHQAANI